MSMKSLNSSVDIHKHYYPQSVIWYILLYLLPYISLFFLFFSFFFFKEGEKSGKLMKILPKITDVPWPK